MAPLATFEDQHLDIEPSPSELELGVIKEARKRQRRRRAAITAPLLAGCGLAIAIILGAGGAAKPPHAQARSQPSPVLGRIANPSAVFVRDPYLGVACHIPNSIACDRVGLSVWLRRSAVVTATIAGASLTLDNPHWSYVAGHGRRAVYVYAGFLQPAGLTTRLSVLPSPGTSSWDGGYAPSPLVRFRIEYGAGKVLFTQEHVFLSAGWG